MARAAHNATLEPGDGIASRIKPETFQRFHRLIYQASGITLRDGKESLVASRIGKRMRILGLSDPDQYLDHVEGDGSGNELVNLLDAISTNQTFFFREAEHFKVLSDYVKKRIADGQTRFRFWSAACSTGDEPYSMAMTILEAAGGRRLDARILATDINTQVLASAHQATYSAENVQNVPAALRSRYFQPTGQPGKAAYRVKEQVRSMVAFRRLNLSAPPFPMKGPLDVVFCRNVMIYFDERVQTGLVNDVYRLLRPEGLLMIGHSESLLRYDLKFRSLGASVYAK